MTNSNWGMDGKGSSGPILTIFSIKASRFWVPQLYMEFGDFPIPNGSKFDDFPPVPCGPGICILIPPKTIPYVSYLPIPISLSARCCGINDGCFGSSQES